MIGDDGKGVSASRYIRCGGQHGETPGTWSQEYPRCPRKYSAVRVMMPSDIESRAKKFALHDVMFFRDKKCTQELDKNLVSYFVTPGYEDSIQDPTKVFDGEKNTKW